MNKRFSYFLLFFCLILNSTYAQKIKFEGRFLLFKEAKTKEAVLIINDSILYKGIVPKRIPFKHSEYPANLHEYCPITIKDKTYLVHEGCGPVLEFRNDSIVWINECYLYRNQYDAVQFVYENEIYFFGGNGLFTTKNILTKYNFKTQDWIQVQTRGEKVQEARAGAYSYLKGNDLYVFGGSGFDVENIHIEKPLDNKVWRLHLPTMEWDCVGTYAQNSRDSDLGFPIYSTNKVDFFLDVFSEIDVNANTLNTYERNNFNEVLSAYIEGDKVVGVFNDNTNLFYQVIDKSEFKGKFKSTAEFIRPLVDDKVLLALGTFFSAVLILVLFIFKKPIKRLVRPFRGFVYDTQKQVFLYKGNALVNLNDPEKKLLLFLLDYQNQFISLIELNKFFENPTGSETYSATIKRREQGIQGLVGKVSKITGIDEDELVIETKNSKDKRIKDIMLLPNLLKRQ